MYVFNCHAVFILSLHVAPLILLRMHHAHAVLNHVVVHLLSSDTTMLIQYGDQTIETIIDNENKGNQDLRFNLTLFVWPIMQITLFAYMLHNAKKPLVVTYVKNLSQCHVSDYTFSR